LRCRSHRSRTVASPEPRRSTSNPRLEVLRRGSGEGTAGPARGTGAVSEGIAGGLIIVIWQPHHRGYSASHWHPGTSVSEGSRRLDCTMSLPGVQIRIPGSDRVRTPWCTGVLRQIFQVLVHLSSIVPLFKN